MYDTNDSGSPSLGQGTTFVTYQHKIKKNNVEETTGDNLGSIIEGLDNYDVSMSLNNYDQSLGDLVDALQIDPNSLTSSEADIHSKDLKEARAAYQTKSDNVMINTNTMVNNTTANLEISDDLYDGISTENNKQADYINEYQSNNESGDNLNARLITINAEEQDTNMSVKSYGFQYLVYIILLITLVSITFRAISSESRVANLVLLIILLLVVFIGAKWLYSKLF